jgi:diguanylate cyclase (GGDEF)-like protein
MLLYALLDRVLPRSFLAKTLAVVVVLGQGPLAALAVLHGAGLIPPGLAWPAAAAATAAGVGGAALGLAAVLRPVDRAEAALAAFERGEPGAAALPETYGDPAGRLMARAAALMRSTESRIGEAERKAELDPLTGLLNRRGLERALAARHDVGARGALVMLDLDHFKSVNDAHGHDTGDRVLRDVAELLRGQMRRPDLAARFGGEEFVLHLAGVGREPALQVAERLRMAVEDRIAVDGRAQTASFGVASWPAGARFADVLKRADAAVYEAKSLGRNRVRFAPGGPAGPAGHPCPGGPAQVAPPAAASPAPARRAAPAAASPGGPRTEPEPRAEAARPTGPARRGGPGLVRGAA